MKATCRAVPVLCAVLVMLSAACDGPDDGAIAEPTVQLVFTPTTLALGEERVASIELRNADDRAAGPVEIVASTVRDGGGNAIPGASLAVSPSEIPTLAAGDSRVIALDLSVPESVADGEYRIDVEARVEGRTVASFGATFSVTRADGPVVVALEITGGGSASEQGDVLEFGATARDGQGTVLPDVVVAWSVEPASAGLVTSRGEFVGYAIGPASVIAHAGDAADTVEIAVSSRDVPAGILEVRAHRVVPERYTSDHWESGDVAFTGTWGCRAVTGGMCGNTLYVWDITTRDSPVLSDSVLVDARVVNDVKVSADGAIAIITHEASGDGSNGITLLDLSVPHHPSVITRFAPADLAPGVHNVWIDGTHAYLVVDGAVPDAGLRVIDIADPTEPRIVASFYGGGSFLHDVVVRDGLAFLSHWTAGLVILDVGAGIAGGSPTLPVEAGRIAPAGYRVHNAWYWPDAGYVFLGDEIGIPGQVLVIDVTDPTDPKQVASFAVEGAAPHNFWIDEASAVAYFAWYENGVHAVDVSGRLLGELEKQGRRIAHGQYDGGGTCLSTAGTCAWAPQLHDGHVYVSDMNGGLWVLRPNF